MNSDDSPDGLIPRMRFKQSTRKSWTERKKQEEEEEEELS